MPLNESDIVLDNFQMKESSIKVEDVPYIEDKDNILYAMKNGINITDYMLHKD